MQCTYFKTPMWAIRLSAAKARAFIDSLAGGAEKSTPANRYRAGEAGLGLIEVILFFSLFVLLVGLLSPMVIQQITNSRIDATREEMQQIQTAILGDVKTGTFGFVGDMGRLPLTLQELRSPIAGTPLHTINNTRGVGMGWNGPYVNWGRNADDFLTDAFGTNYDFGRAGAGQLRSAGPDLQFGTADDILVPPQPINFTGRLAVTVRTYDGQAYQIDPVNCAVSAYYSEGGVERLVGDSAPPFLFENLPRGLHAVSVTCGTQDVTGQPGASATAAVQGYGQTNVIELALAVSQSITAVSGQSGEGSTSDSLSEARDMLFRQQSLIQQRSDLSPMLKQQYEAVRGRVLSSIDLAVKQRETKDLAASQRNLQRAVSELDVLYGFVRKSPIGNPQVKESQAILEMETQIRERLNQSLANKASKVPPK